MVSILLSSNKLYRLNQSKGMCSPTLHSGDFAVDSCN